MAAAGPAVSSAATMAQSCHPLLREPAERVSETCDVRSQLRSQSSEADSARALVWAWDSHELPADQRSQEAANMDDRGVWMLKDSGCDKRTSLIPRYDAHEFAVMAGVLDF